MFDLVKRDCEKRQLIRDEIKAGLGGNDDWHWRDRANVRIIILNDDERQFGLVAHEKEDRRELQRLIDETPPPETTK